MKEKELQTDVNRLYQAMLIIGIIVAAFNLRPAITSVGPVMGIIRDDIGLSNWSVAFLTSLPLIAFAIMSPLVPRLGHYISNERNLILGLSLLIAGILVRSIIPEVSFLFIGTLFAGFGIAICNVLLPGIIKEKFPLKVGLMTSIYSTAMGIFASLASGLSIPIARGMNLGWQVALQIWVIPAIAGIFIWIYLAGKNKKSASTNSNAASTSGRIWRSPLAWQIASFLGLQSFLFYVTVSWLPEILLANGVDRATAGWMLSFLLLVGLPASFVVPMIAAKYSSQRHLVFILGSFSIIGYVGLLIGASHTLLVLCVTLVGLGLNGNFSLALVFLAIRARNAHEAASLSGMAQSPGYVLAAIGPIFIGYLSDLTGNWNVPVVVLIIVSALVMMFGVAIGKERYVFG